MSPENIRLDMAMLTCDCFMEFQFHPEILNFEAKSWGVFLFNADSYWSWNFEMDVSWRSWKFLTQIYHVGGEEKLP